MAKVKPYKISKKERFEIIGDFYQIVTGLKNKKDVVGFFVGLLTPSEAVMFARRIQIAQMLLDNKSIAEIKATLNVGSNTVASVSSWLFDDNNNIFQQHILKYMKTQKKARKKRYNNSYYTSELDKYPQHRIWKKLLGL